MWRQGAADHDAADVLFFSSYRSADARLTLHDALGRDLRLLHDGALDAGETALALDTAGLPAGVYVVWLLADGVAVSHTLSIVR